MHQTFFLNFCAAAQVLPFFLKFVIHILARILNSWPSCGSVIEGEKSSYVYDHLLLGHTRNAIHCQGLV
jgi:hypothetical protein